MNSLWFAGLLPLLLAAAPIRPEDPKPAEGVPAPTNIRGARVSPDPRRPAGDVPHQGARRPEGRVRFLRRQRYPAKKDKDGFWTATTDPQVPGFHYYWVFIDGVQVNDPASETFYGTGKETSGIEVPEKGVDYYLPQGRAARRGPRALVLLEDDRGLAARSSSTPRPATTPTATRGTRCSTCSTAAARTSAAGRTRGASAFIMDNLIAEKKAKPMIVVMEKGYARKARRAGPPSPAARPAAPARPRRRAPTSAGCSPRSRR